jgi:hypothetical protein
MEQDRLRHHRREIEAQRATDDELAHLTAALGRFQVGAENFGDRHREEWADHPGQGKRDPACERAAHHA